MAARLFLASAAVALLVVQSNGFSMKSSADSRRAFLEKVRVLLDRLHRFNFAYMHHTLVLTSTSLSHTRYPQRQSLSRRA